MKFPGISNVYDVSKNQHKTLSAKLPGISCVFTVSHVFLASRDFQPASGAVRRWKGPRPAPDEKRQGIPMFPMDSGENSAGGSRGVCAARRAFPCVLRGENAGRDLNSFKSLPTFPYL